MNAGVTSQLRVKSGDQVPAFLHQHRVALILGKNPRFGSDLPNDGSADEDRFNRSRPGARGEACAGFDVALKSKNADLLHEATTRASASTRPLRSWRSRGRAYQCRDLHWLRAVCTDPYSRSRL